MLNLSNNHFYVDHEAYYGPLNIMGTNLLQLEKFYDSLGGLVGYQLKSLQLIRGGLLRNSCDNGSTGVNDRVVEYLMPSCLDLSQEASAEVRKAVVEGILCVPRMAEIYAVGGEMHSGYFLYVGLTSIYLCHRESIALKQHQVTNI